ncbi:exodeoxyribonuclease VII large subunit [Ancylobacter dichloromethanicus]|uniref:Exodeoxyribonuclease 7 large subunit n=1 Tax=Ancylobacter dichloromethanicus TaxID=518825 RepID=A0A9W6MZG0_9HYPH|nr:exodeoxyribonuclease VII large subunit [Ancylobacter dichloromethanicus]MBS7552605.1 exodeoxyribonuclease VII large subunit [Ancylobacter dichloromethanicus]GLK71967.1 exodeoxyribonuclease 7 large subunit [Ancylobacter dichloromethanicus]
MPDSLSESPVSNAADWTVSELSGALKRTVEDSFGHVRVRGEISGYRGPHSSGHAYFSLKDQNARLDAVVWKGVFGRLKLRPEEGLEVVAIGRITTFPGKSSYQIVIEQLEFAGAGAIMAMLEERKLRLAAEGLFAPERKRRPPFLPAVIGVVTSPTGAVIRDILHRLADRFPRHVLVWPVRVQGDTSGAEVSAAIRGFSSIPAGGLALAAGGLIPRPDVIIVARGGGSLEDLLGFSEESVVRAAAESEIPLISAVGHETDITLIDFAADIRAPTPTAAAEMAVPVRADLVAELAQFHARLRAGFARGLDRRRTDLRSLVRLLPSADALLALPRQRLDIAGQRLPRALKANASAHRLRLARAESRFGPQVLTSALTRRRERVAVVGARLPRGLTATTAGHRLRLTRVDSRLRLVAQSQRDRRERGRDRLDGLLGRLRRCRSQQAGARAGRLDAVAKLLAALSYKGVLARGFALVRNGAGAPVHAAEGITAGDALEIEFRDGRVAVRATGSGPDAPPPARPPRKPAKTRAATPLPDEPRQPTLFDK